MPTLARLTLWHDPEASTLLLDAFDEHLTPVLAGHGLTDLAPCPRPSTPGVLNYLYPLDTPAAVRAAARALHHDPTWQAEMARLAPLCGPRPACDPAAGQVLPPALPWAFGLYSTPADPGRSVPAGPGARRGLGHAYGLADGLPSPVVNHLLQDSRDRLWMTTGDGICCFDGSRFTHWTADDGLPHPTPLGLAQDAAGHLWFATEAPLVFARQGLCRYDGQTFDIYT
ncbi:MAG: two-component regulator propeller domain-containing protein, partial [Gemmatimonadota bacterium]